jgi:alpha-1,6-mannosyltransferase
VGCFLGGGDESCTTPFAHVTATKKVVPRTFAGPILLAYTCRLLLWPWSAVTGMTAIHPLFVQFLARLVLLVANVFGWIRLATAVDRKTAAAGGGGRPIGTGTWLLLVTACQFHVPYYASRMLPNTFALAVVLQCYACWMDGKVVAAASLLVMGTAIFRCDLLLLLGSVGMSWLITRQLTILGALKIGVLTGMAALALTIPLDSLLWQRPLWPEGEVFYFNTILGKSTEWGTSPWHWYFTSALPKAMLLTILLVPLAVLRILEQLVSWEYSYRRKEQTSKPNGKEETNLPVLRTNELIDTTWLPYLVPVFGFVFLYSFLGHKEMRFIFPAIPILNLGAAAGMSKLTRLAFPLREKKDNLSRLQFSWIAWIGFASGIFCILVTLCGSLTFVAVSRWNYPGGDALAELTSHIQATAPKDTASSVKVYIDVASAMSGVSLFGQRAAQAETPNVKWEFTKDGYEEGRSVGQEEWESFTHLLLEEPRDLDGFRIIRVLPGTPRLSIRERRIVTEDTIYIMEKTEWSGQLTEHLNNG